MCIGSFVFGINRKAKMHAILLLIKKKRKELNSIQLFAFLYKIGKPANYCGLQNYVSGVSFSRYIVCVGKANDNPASLNDRRISVFTCDGVSITSAFFRIK